MAKLKLTYFDFHGGRGEPARLALSIGGIAFEDDRFQTSDWERRKGDTPFGALPVLEVDGQIVAQSNAINRYVGKLADLYPSDPWQAALCDEAMEAVEDITNKIAATLFIPEEQKKAQRKTLVDGPIPFYSPGCSSGSKHVEAGTSPPTACRSRISRFSYGSDTLGPEHSIMCRLICPIASHPSSSSTTSGLRMTRASKPTMPSMVLPAEYRHLTVLSARDLGL